MKRSLFHVSTLALLSIGFACSASAQTISRIVFFGDSLSDSGNNFIFTGQSSRQPFSLTPPSYSYDIGGHHFSNGPTWAEQLSTALHIPNSGQPSLRAPGLFTDYAVGDARSRSGSPVFPDFDLTIQVGHFLSDFGGQAPANTLFVIWIGANDVEDALNALSVDPSGATSVGIIQAAIAAITANVETLYGDGARMFLIANVPDLSKTPYVRFLGANVDPSIPAIASLFTGYFNQGLATTAAGLSAGLPGLSYFQFFDVNALFTQLLASPTEFGISDTTDRCTVPNVVGHALCAMPKSYLFWDGIHPTTTGHTAITGVALSLLP